MERNIKTRSVIKDIKTFDKRANITRSIRQAGSKSKEAFDDIAAPKQKPDKNTPYAEGKTEAAIESGVSTAARSTGNAFRGATVRASDARKLSKDAAATTAHKAAQRASDAAGATAKTVVDTTQANRRSVKTASRSIETTRATGKAAKGIGRSAQVANATAKGAGAAKTAAHNASIATRAVARSAASAAKVAARGVAGFARMAIAAVVI